MLQRAIFSTIGRALYLTVILTVSLFFNLRAQSYVPAYNAASEQWGRNWNLVVKNLEEAARIAQLDEGIYDRDYLTILNDLGIAYLENGNPAKATKTFDSLLELYHQLDDFPGSEYWTARLNYARVLKVSAPDSAFHTYASLLDAPYLSVRISGLEGAYQTLVERGLINRAEQLLKDLPRVQEPDMFELRSLLLQLDLSRRQGRYFEMDSLFEAFDNEIQNNDDPAFLQAAHLGVLEQQGLYWKDVGEFRKAEMSFQDHLSYKSYLGLPESENTATFNYLSALYADNGLFQQALENIDSALAHCTYGCTGLRQNKAVILASTGQAAQAQELLMEIARTGNFMSPEEELSFHLNYLSGAVKSIDRQQSLERAGEIVKNQGDQVSPMLRASYYEISGRTFLQLGKHELAIEDLTRALKIQEDILGKSSLRLRVVQNYLGIAYMLNGDLNQSSVYLNRATEAEFRFVKFIYPLLSRSEQMMFLRRLRQDLYLTYSAIIEFAGEDQRFLELIARGQMIYKGLTLNVKKHHNTEIDSTNVTLLRTMSEYNHLRKQLADEYLGMFRNAETLEIEAIETKISALESSINRMSPSSGSWDEALTSADLAAQLSENEALVEIIRLPRIALTNGVEGRVSYLALVIRPDRPLQLIHMPDGQFLEERQLKFYLNSIRFGLTDTTSLNTIWAPIRTAVQGVDLCYVVQDGLYHRVNMGVLWDNSKSEYLASQMDFVILGNAQELLTKKSSSGAFSSETSASLIGDPVLSEGSDQFEQLPGTKKEIEEISAYLKSGGFDVGSYLNVAATKENIFTLAPSGIIHFATHGYFSTQEMVGREKLPDVELFRSGLVLTNPESTDGDLLSAFEVASLDLQSTDLVVLSACETGLGELQHGDGVYGLQYAFFAAGAKTLILSLWKVDDQVTREFMIHFYQRLVSTSNKRQAFKQAVASIKETYPDPKHWGAFIYLGD